MAFIEHSAVLSGSDAAATKANTVDFLKNTLGMIQDSENDMIFWCHEQKTVGLRISESGSYGMYAVIHTANGTESPSEDFSIASSSATLYWQMSKDKDVIYLREYRSSSSTTVGRMAFAKSDNGDWCAFNDNYMYHKNGRMYIGSPNITANSNTPFSVVKMPNLAAGGSFLNFYKFLTATSFTLSGTYVDFDGKPFRAVCTATSSGSSSSIAANYAYPVADES